MSACVIILIDESPVMATPMPGGSTSKMDAVATAVNSVVKQLSSVPGGAAVEVGLLAYLGDPFGNPQTVSRLPASMAGRSIVPVSELVEHPIRVEKRLRHVPNPAMPGMMTQQEIDFPVWYEPQPGNFGSKERAFAEVKAVLEQWFTTRQEHNLPVVAPPLVINIVSGIYANDLLSAAAAPLIQWSTPVGNPIVLNLLPGDSASVPPIKYSTTDQYLLPGPSQDLFLASTVMPQFMVDSLLRLKENVLPGARGQVFNAKLSDLFNLLRLAVSYGEAVKAVCPEFVPTPHISGQAAPEQPVSEKPVSEQPVSEQTSKTPEPIQPVQPIQPQFPEPAQTPEPVQTPGSVQISEPVQTSGSVQISEQPTLSVMPVAMPSPVSTPAPVSIPVPETTPAPVESPVQEQLTLSVLSGQQPEETPLEEPRSKRVIFLLDASSSPTQAGVKAWRKRLDETQKLLGRLAQRGQNQFDVSLIVYGLGQNETVVQYPFGGMRVVSDDQIFGSALRVEETEKQVPNGIGGLITLKQKIPIFYEVPAEPLTVPATVQAIEPEPNQPPTGPADVSVGMAAVVELLQRSSCFSCLDPVVLVHVTGGSFAPASLAPAMAAMAELQNCVPTLVHTWLFTEQPGASVRYPKDGTVLDSELLNTLFQQSSPLKNASAIAAAGKIQGVSADSRGFVVNAPFDAFFAMFE